MKQLEDIIKLTVEDTIRRQLPIKEILKEHLETYDEPKQRPDMYRAQGVDTQQKPVDMQMLLDELKKANSQNIKPHDENSDNEDNEDDDYDEMNQQYSPSDAPLNDISLKKEEEEEEIEQENNISDVTTPVSTTSVVTPPEITTPETSISEDKFIDPYKDPNDPDESQIEKATQNIVLNDITEPVIEETYDNVDIVN